MHNINSSTSTKNMIADSFMNRRLFISVYYIEELNQYKGTIEYEAFYKGHFKCKRMYCIPNDVNTICKELFDIYFRDYELGKIIYNTIAEHYNEMLLKLQMRINPNKPDVEQVRFPDYPDTSVTSISPNSIFANPITFYPTISDALTDSGQIVASRNVLNELGSIPNCKGIYIDGRKYEINTNNGLEIVSSEEYERLEEEGRAEKDKYYLILDE